MKTPPKVTRLELPQLHASRLHDGGEVFRIADASAGLNAIIAISSTRRGPAIGGCRVRPYTSEAEALEDAISLAGAMAQKAALAGLPHGGGKAVIFSPVPDANRALVFQAFGRAVDQFGGRYMTTEDAGTDPRDMDAVRSATTYVLGTSLEQGGSGDPSAYTGLGVRRGMEAAANHVFGRPGLHGLRVAIQGAGHVGLCLARELHTAGAKLIVSDLDPLRSARVAAETGAEVVASGDILTCDCEVLAPCAFGGILTEDLVPSLRCQIVAGAANNQLASPAAGDALHTRGVLYVPDYALNAGGLISVAGEFAGHSRERVLSQTSAIYETISGILTGARALGQAPDLVADRMALAIISAGSAAD